MKTLDNNRRTLIMAGALTAALMPLREATAQVAGRGGDWLAMVRAHHALIEKSLNDLVASESRTYMQRDRLMAKVGYQLTAHSVAEENILYPALAISGMVAESDKLYLDQAHAKVMNAQVELLSREQGSRDWVAAATNLRAAVLTHAKDDEEGRLYPQLQQRLTAAQNALLTAGYAREFASVRPRRASAT